MLVSISERLLEVGRERSEAAPDARAALVALVEWHVDFALRDRPLIVVQDRDWESLPDDAREQVRRLQREYVDLWAGRLREVHAGLRPDSARAMAHAAFGLINSTPHSALLPDARMRELLTQMAVRRAGDLLGCRSARSGGGSPGRRGTRDRRRRRDRDRRVRGRRAGRHGVQRPAASRHPARRPGLLRRVAPGDRLRQHRRAARQRGRQQRPRGPALPAQRRVLRDGARPGGRSRRRRTSSTAGPIETPQEPCEHPDVRREQRQTSSPCFAPATSTWSSAPARSRAARRRDCSAGHGPRPAEEIRLDPRAPGDVQGRRPHRSSRAAPSPASTTSATSDRVTRSTRTTRPAR